MVVIAMGKKQTLASEPFEKLALSTPIYYLATLIHRPHYRMCQDLKRDRIFLSRWKQSVLTVYFFHLLPVISCQSCLAAALSVRSPPLAPDSHFLSLLFFLSLSLNNTCVFTIAAFFLLYLFFLHPSCISFFRRHPFCWQLSSIVNASMKRVDKQRTVAKKERKKSFIC